MKGSAPRAARGSSLELLRILCMLFIIADHLCGQSGIARYDSLPAALWFSFLGSGSRIGCMAFVFIGGWFLCQSPFKARRPLGLWLSLWLYTFPLTLLARLLPAAGVTVTWGDLRWALFPASTRQLWFISDYLLLLLLSPLLNAGMAALSRAAHKALLLTLGAVLAGYPTLFAEDGLAHGEIWAFLYAYLLIAYLRRWPQNRLAAFLQKRAAALAVGLGVPAALTAAKALLLWHGMAGKTLQYVEYYRTSLCALPVLAAALALFYLFKSFGLGTVRAVNAVASAVPGVYILHQVPVWQSFLWNGILDCAGHAGSVPYSLFAVLAVFAGCTAIDLLRARFVLRPLQHSAPFRAVCRRWDAAWQKIAPDPGMP